VVNVVLVPVVVRVLVFDAVVVVLTIMPKSVNSRISKGVVTLKSKSENNAYINISYTLISFKEYFIVLKLYSFFWDVFLFLYLFYHEVPKLIAPLFLGEQLTSVLS